MAFDPYSVCPGGTGKKIKFCCADLQTELQKIDRMLEGEQIVGTVEHIERVEKDHTHRACLLAIKAELQMAQKQYEPARKTIDEFLLYHPTNPVALANDAILMAMAGEQERAVNQLQTALEQSAESISPRVYEALGVVANMLLMKQRLPAARAHFILQASLGGEHDQRALNVLMQMNSSAALPTLFKEDLQLVPWQGSPHPGPLPKGEGDVSNAPAKAQFDAALMAGSRASWRAAEKQFAALLPQAEKVPALWRNLALLRSWLGDNDGAAKAWRTLATLDVPLDDAIEAEATAQLLEPDPVGEPLEVVTLTYPIPDFEALESRLSADKRASRLQVDLSQLAEEGAPQPRGAYFLLDRPLPATSAGLTRSDVPGVYGQFFLYGKETDREARLEFVVVRDAAFEKAKQALADVAGDTIRPNFEEHVTSHASAMQNALSFNWRFPDDAPEELREKLVAEQQRATLLECWPATPMRLFGGKSPKDAAGDPSQKIKVLAAILNLELSATEPGRAEIYNELRGQLSLPSAGQVDSKSPDMAELPLARLSRLEPAALTDEQLVSVYSRAVALGVTSPAQRLGKEMVGRGDIFDLETRSEVYLFLARTEQDPTLAVAYIEQGRQAAEAAKQSSARFDLEELALQIERREIRAVSRLIDHIAREHRQEPGVAQALYRLLLDAGIVGQDGQMLMQLPPAAPVAEPAAAKSEIWTPGGTQATGEKSKLWMPGME